MALRKIADVQPGMCLAKPVMNPQGKIIAQEGEALTERHLRLFKSWGVPEVDIAAAAVGPPPPAWALPPEALQALTRSIDERFAGRTDHPAMAEIARVSKILLLQRPPPQPSQEETDG